MKIKAVGIILLCLLIFIQTACKNSTMQSESTLESEQYSETLETGISQETVSEENPSVKQQNGRDTDEVESETVKNSESISADDTKADTDISEGISDGLRYPVFTEFTNSDLINQLVVDYVSELDEFYKANDTIALTMDYQIMFQDNHLISIYFTGSVSGAAYPRTYKSTLNINVDEASRITLGQIAAVDDELKEAIESQVNNELELMGTTMSDDIKSTLDRLDTADTTTSDIQTYFTSEELVVIIGVQHVLGDYIEVSIPLSNFENMIK